MTVTQISTLLNSIVKELMGTENIVQEDLSNIVDVGNTLFDNNQMDNYVKKLVDRIGKTVFDNRKYQSNVPGIFMDSWEYGSIMQKVSMDLPEATENDSWKLTDKQTYSQDIFYQPKIQARYYNKQVTFEIPMSFTTKQIKSSFNSVDELNGFIAMVENTIQNTITIKMDSLVMRTINMMIGKTLESAKGEETDFTTVNKPNAVNLLKLYNTQFTKTLTKDKALFDPDFIRFAVYTMNTYKDRMSRISTLFNIGGKEKFTQDDNFKMVVLSDFKSTVKSYIQADSFNKELSALPMCDTVPYWQGSGKGYSLGDISKINVALGDGKSVECDYILGAMFDRESVGVTNQDSRVTTSYNAKGEFYNNYYKFDAGYFCNMNENFIVFFLA